MNDDLRLLYGWVRRTRENLFAYTQALPPETLIHEHPDVGFGSIRNLHAHVANCYLWWLGEVGFGRDSVQVDPQQIPDTAAMRQLFAKVDLLVEEALTRFDDPDRAYDWTHPKTGWKERHSQRWLVMHPITHEFNHKGQILTLGRLLGHSFPSNVDADLVQPL